MFGFQAGSAFHTPVLSHGAVSVGGPKFGARRLALRASGVRHGPITRLITPWSIGELTTPFVSLDYAEATPASRPLFDIKPSAGVATLTLVLSGELSLEDTTGDKETVGPGRFGWMTAAHGPWCGGGLETPDPLRVFQLRISLPPAQQTALASHGIGPHEVQAEPPVRVILGRFGGACTPLPDAPTDLNVFQVRLRDGERWRYAAPSEHNVTWLAVDRGVVHLQEGERVYWEQLGVFADSGGVIDAQAEGDTSFLLGSAKRRPSG